MFFSDLCMQALESYDLATSWMEGDGEKDVVRK